MKEITLKAVVDSIPAVTEFIDAELMALDCPMKVQMQIDVAIDEVFSNIAHYAYIDGNGEATVRFEQHPEQGCVTVEFRDRGKPFNSLAQNDPDVTQSAAERKIGGLGVFLVKKLMDEVSYRYEDGMNVLRMSKKLR